MDMTKDKMEYTIEFIYKNNNSNKQSIIVPKNELYKSIGNMNRPKSELIITKIELLPII